MKTLSLYRRGFTIVELLVVVVVTGILAAVVIVGYNGITGTTYSIVPIPHVRARVRSFCWWRHCESGLKHRKRNDRFDITTIVFSI